MSIIFGNKNNFKWDYTKINQKLQDFIIKSKNYLDNKSKTDLGMIDGFAYKMTEYAKKKNTVTIANIVVHHWSKSVQIALK